MSSIDILRKKRESADSSEDENSLKENSRILDLVDNELNGLQDGPVSLLIKGNLFGSQVEIESIQNQNTDYDASGNPAEKPAVIKTHTQLMPS